MYLCFNILNFEIENFQNRNKYEKYDEYETLQLLIEDNVL